MNYGHIAQTDAVGFEPTCRFLGGNPISSASSLMEDRRN